MARIINVSGEFQDRTHYTANYIYHIPLQSFKTPRDANLHSVFLKFFRLIYVSKIKLMSESSKILMEFYICEIIH